jgi:iron-only hydrogenase group A
MKVTLNGKKVRADKGQTILELCKKNNIDIPTLCYEQGFEPEARCRMCIVEVDGSIVTSCNTPVKQDMVIKTNTKKILKYRKLMTELTAAEHTECFIGVKQHELCKIISDVGLRHIRFEPRRKEKIDVGKAIVRDDKRCVLCGRCVQACKKQATGAIDFAFRSYHTRVVPYFDHDLGEIYCTNCGQCVLSCPVDAITEKDSIKEVEKALKSKNKKVIVQTAPSIRASLGEEFGMKPGTLVTGKMVAALRKLGFYKVFDTNLGADFTTTEEAAELVENLKKGKKFKKPMFTSCCPAWVKFVEHFYPEFIPNLSTSKSPHEMFGAIAKTYYAKKLGVKKKDLILVSVMPCTAKKFEAVRKEHQGFVDYVLTTRELARMIYKNNIDFKNLKQEDFDKPLGISSGAGAIYGATSGVMESALRSAYFFMTGKELKNVDFKNVRGFEGVKKADVKLGKKKIRIGVTHGLGNAVKILEDIKKGAKYDFVEIMACPGGCIGGGGQPIPTNDEIRKARISALYKQDKKIKVRKAHKNPALQQIYTELLGKPLSKKAHKLLHTKYKKRGPF